MIQPALEAIFLMERL